MAALNAPGFSEKQRWELFEISGYARSHFRVSPLLQYWPFEVLGRKPNVEEDVAEVRSHLLVVHAMLPLHALLISYACYYSFTRPSSLSTTPTPNLRTFVLVTSSISWINWTWILVLWIVLEKLSGRCSPCFLRGRLRRLQKGGKPSRRMMREDRQLLFPCFQSFWRATIACVSSKHIHASLPKFSMIRSMLSVATSSVRWHWIRASPFRPSVVGSFATIQYFIWRSVALDSVNVITAWTSAFYNTPKSTAYHAF